MSKEPIRKRDGMRYNTNSRRLDKKDFPTDKETEIEQVLPDNVVQELDKYIEKEQERLEQNHDLMESMLDMIFKLILKTPELADFREKLRNALNDQAPTIDLEDWKEELRNEEE